jgi:hypothetical protein
VEDCWCLDFGLEDCLINIFKVSLFCLFSVTTSTYGPRLLQLTGPFIAASATLGLGFVNQSTNYGAIAVTLFIVGAGHGVSFFFVAISSDFFI